MSNDIEAERKLFEVWFSADGKWPTLNTRDSNGEYEFPLVNDAWGTWQARAALVAPPIRTPENTMSEMTVTEEIVLRNELAELRSCLDMLMPPATPVLSDEDIMDAWSAHAVASDYSPYSLKQHVLRAGRALLAKATR